ncbi:hypothetical protein OKW37_001893 [Paraburkholderia sp. MM5482-R2]
MRTSCRAWATRATGCSVRRTDAPGASGVAWRCRRPGTGPAFARIRPSRRHIRAASIHFRVDFMAFAAGFAARPPLPHPRGMIKFESARRSASTRTITRTTACNFDWRPALSHQVMRRLAAQAAPLRRVAALRLRLAGRSCTNRHERPPAGKRGTTRGNGQAEIGGTGGRLDGPTRATSTSGRQPFT